MAFRDEVYGVSGDGSLVVGTRWRITTRPLDDPWDAWIWDESHGMRKLQHMLTDDFGLDLTDWRLVEATDISDEGRVIVGWGRQRNPGGGWTRRGYRAVIPEPSSYVLLCSALACLLVYARGRRRRGWPTWDNYVSPLHDFGKKLPTPAPAKRPSPTSLARTGAVLGSQSHWNKNTKI